MRRLVSAGLALICAAAPALAQETGTLITRRPASVEFDTREGARNTMRQFGDCTVARSRISAKRLIDSPADSPEYERRVKFITKEECLGAGTLVFPFTVLRGALFEALYRNEFGRSGPADFAATPAFDYRGGYSGALSPLAASTVAIGRFGDCVARADGAAARDMLLSQPETTDEKAALKRIKPKLSGCVVQGQTTKFSPSMLRSAIAEGMYRLSTSGQTSG